MSKVREGGRFLFLFILFFSVAFIFLNFQTKESARDSKNLFSLMDKANGIPYVINSRKNIDTPQLLRILYNIELLIYMDHTKIKALAQKIVWETISQERCHSISLDFGPYGYVDFAPFGKLLKTGDIPPQDYENYRFHYVFY